MAEPPGQYSSADKGLFEQFYQSEGLTFKAPSNTGTPNAGFNPNLGFLVKDPATGKKERITPSSVDAFTPDVWQASQKDLLGVYFPEPDLMLNNYERYAVSQGNSYELGQIYDDDRDSGYSIGFESQAFVADDNSNTLSRAIELNQQMAATYFTENPKARNTMTVAEGAKAFLDARNLANAEALKAAREAYGQNRGGSGSPSTVRTVEQVDAQNLRAVGDPQAEATIGRTLGVGESEQLTKQLNREARKNPSVTTGLGTSQRKTTPGYNFTQGVKDALLGSPDSEAYQKNVRAINILGSVLGTVQ